MINASKAARWITSRRLRAHAVILGLCLWSAYLWNMSSPGLLDRANNLKGADFLHFYVLGSLARADRGADLYNLNGQSQLAWQRVAVAAGIRYLPLYPPQVSILFAPLARLSYGWALVLWLILSVVLYGLCCYFAWTAAPHLRIHALTVFILALAFPAFWHLIAWGQTSGIALACFTLAFFALRADHEFLAGLAFGCLIFKPQLGIAAAVLFMIKLRWKVIAGAILSAAAQLGVGVLFYGPTPLRAWVHALLNVSNVLPMLEPRLYQTHSLRTFWLMLIPSPTVSLVLYLSSALLTCALAVVCWRSRLPLSVRYSSLLLATVLVAPHLTVYDLVILAPAFLFLSDWLLAQPQMVAAGPLKLLLYFAYALPLIGPLARWTHFQLTVPVMAALLYVISVAGKKQENPKLLLNSH